MAILTPQDALYSAVVNNENVSAIIGSRFYAHSFPSNWSAPCLLYNEISVPQMLTHGGRSSGTKTRFQITAFHASSKGCETLCETAIQVLDGLKMQWDNISITSAIVLDTPSTNHLESLEVYRAIFTVDIWTTKRKNLLT